MRALSINIRNLCVHWEMGILVRVAEYMHQFFTVMLIISVKISKL